MTWKVALMLWLRALTPHTRVLPYLHQFSFFAVTWLWSEIQFRIRWKLSVCHITFPVLNPIDFRMDFMILTGSYMHVFVYASVDGRYHFVL